MKYGGMAGFNSVTFSTDNYVVTAKNTKNGIVINERKTVNNEFQFEKYIDRIPIIRGYWLIFKTFIQGWKIAMTLFLIIMINTFLVMNLSESNTSGTSQVSIVQMSYILIPLILVFRFLNIAKYHGAEHMIGNVYDKNLELNLDNARKQSTIHADCGTNLAVFAVMVFLILYYFFYTPDVRGALVISLTIPIAYEIFKVENKVFKNIVKPFYLIGYLCQYLFFTSKPNDEQLEVALKSFERLVELERNKSIT